MHSHPILVPTDGSPLAERAFAHAAALAQATHAPITLLRSIAAANPPLTEFAEEYVDIVQQYLDERRYQFAGHPDVETRITSGDPASAIVAAANDLKAGLIVMSSHGRGGLGRWLYGSVADGVLRHTTLPTLVVLPACEPPGQNPGTTSMLVSLDGGPNDGLIVRSVAQLARGLGAQFRLLHVIDPEELGESGHSMEVFQEAREHLESLAGQLEKRHMVVSIGVERGEPARAIAQAARHYYVAVLALGLRARHDGDRVLGRVGSSLLHYATSPVLFVPLH